MSSTTMYEFEDPTVKLSSSHKRLSVRLAIVRCKISTKGFNLIVALDLKDKLQGAKENFQLHPLIKS